MTTINKEILDRLDRIEQMAAINAKPVLTMDEASVFLGMSKSSLYHLTSDREIPHFKQGKRIYFRKDELVAWMTECRVSSNSEISRKAATYVSTYVSTH